MSFASGIALALATVLNVGSNAAALIEPMPQAQTVEEYVQTYFADEPIMIAIAGCESHFKQFDKDGSVHRGKANTKDVGVMQINEYFHSKTADKLGLDIYSIEGNVAYARYLYEKEGTKPWKSSQYCWDKEVPGWTTVAAVN